MPPKPVYLIQRAAIVPVVAPRVNPGGGVARTGITESSIVPQPPRPVLRPNSGAGLYLPLHTLALEPRIALGRTTELRLNIEAEADGGPLTIRRADLSPPHVPPVGFGAGISTHQRFTEDWFLTLGADLFGYDIPSRVRVECVQNCASAEPGYVGDSIEHASVVVVRVETAAGYEGDFGSVYVLLGARNQPTNVRSGSESTYEAPDRDPEVSGGAPYGLLGLGFTIRLHESFDLVGQLYAPFGGEPIVYGPVATFGVFAGLPGEK